MLEQLQIIHLIAFGVFFVLLFVLEYIFPLREKTSNTKKRWFHNWSLSLINTFVVRILSFVTPVSFALYCETQEWGLFNNISLPLLKGVPEGGGILEILVTIVILDFCIYLQHVASHKFPWFWKFHQIHHSDENLDVSTALRFHVGEISISLIYKVFLVGVFGFSALGIVIFEIILVCSAIFNHANLRIPIFLEKYMSYVFVTPQFHQVHHSVIHTETDSNYGFFFSFWDRLCKTYTPHNFFVEKLGLNYTRKSVSFWNLLLLKIKKSGK